MSKFLTRKVGRKYGKLLYNALVHFHLLHGVAYWGVSTKAKLKKLRRLQSRAIKTISLTRTDEIVPEKLGTLSLSHALTYSACCFLRSQITNRGPKVLDLKMLGDFRDTRATKGRMELMRRTQAGRSSHYVRTARIWNCLPRDTRTTDSTILFKKRLKRLLLENEGDRLRYF